MQRLSTSIAGLLVAAVFTAGTAGAYAQVNGKHKKDNQVRFASWEEANQQFSEMQTELSSLRAQVDGVPISQDIGWGDGCATCGACDDCYCNLGCRWYAGAEVVVVKPHFEEGVDKINGVQFEPEYDIKGSPRVWLGYQNHAGLGLRLRYWNWDHLSADGDFQDQPDTPMKLKVQALDFDVTQLVNWGPVETNLVGGLRYSYVEHRESDGEGHRFEGWGPTFGCESLLPISCTNWAFVLNARAAMAFGEAKFVEERDEIFLEDEDDLLWTLESQLGLQYSTVFCSGHVLALRAVLEGQYWSSATEDPDGGVRNEQDNDLGFFGFTIGLEYLF
ncbi:MAG: Lpg1974 family pore-forming outer membrane protein [Planctomycetota bacterium]|nr:Lpg1974 family pore-forming outer membrane protein [Planctomycetota bacterium]